MGITFPKNIKKQAEKVPSWLKVDEVKEAYDSAQSDIAKVGLKKEASSSLIVISYVDSHGKVIFADDERITKQKNAGVKELLDDAGKPLIPYKQGYAKTTETSNVHSVAQVKEIDRREREIHPSYVVNSIISRHTQYKALQALSNHASNCGLFGARCRYINGKIASTEGKHFQNYTEVTAEIDFIIGPRVHKHITASIGIDAAGKFILPQVFKDPTGEEHPFTRDAVAELLRGMEYEKPPREQNKRSDTPTYKRPDKSRFNAG